MSCYFRKVLKGEQMASSNWTSSLQVSQGDWCVAAIIADCVLVCTFKAVTFLMANPLRVLVTSNTLLTTISSFAVFFTYQIFEHQIKPVVSLWILRALHKLTNQTFIKNILKCQRFYSVSKGFKKMNVNLFIWKWYFKLLQKLCGHKL